MLEPGDAPLSRAKFDALQRALGVDDHPAPTVDAKEASVLVPLFERDGQIMVVLTQRTEDMPTHPGQVAFPGGSRELADIDRYTTAVRETEEEIGLPVASAERIGQIDTLPTYASTFIVSAFAASITPPPAWVPSVREIAAIYEIPLSDLERARTMEQRGRDGIRFTMPLFPMEDCRVWGFTAFVLARFLDLTAKVRADFS